MDGLTLFLIGSGISIIALIVLTAFILKRVNIPNNARKIIFAAISGFIVMPVLMPVPNFIFLPVPHIIFLVVMALAGNPSIPSLPAWYAQNIMFHGPSFLICALIFWVIAAFTFKRTLPKPENKPSS